MVAQRKRAGSSGQSRRRLVRIDPFRAFVFPNHIRDLRRRAGFPKLLQLSHKLLHIPYIRLSKIERGEVFARPEELAGIADALGVSPLDLLIDVDDPDFDLEAWVMPFGGSGAVDRREEELAVLLGAALHLRRSTDRGLSVAALNADFGLPPVIISRLENAAKTIDRWNDNVIAGLLKLFGVGSIPALKRLIEADFEAGRLDPFIGKVSDPARRQEKSRLRIAEIRRQLAGGNQAQAKPFPAQPPSSGAAPGTVEVRLLQVFGAPLSDGLIAPVETGEKVAAPLRSGPRAYGLKLGRPTLGGGMPGNAVLIVDPDRLPSSGGLAVVAEGDSRRAVTVIVDRHGAMKGYSDNPDREIALDTLDPANVAAVIAAVFG